MRAPGSATREPAPQSGTAALIAEGITYRQIEYWCRKGYLRVESTGSGVSREWPREEIRVARLMGTLTAAGMGTAAAADIARRAAQHAEGTVCRFEIRPGVWIEVTS